MIQVKNIAVTFNKDSALEMRALRGVTLDIPKGQFVTVIGSNGAGKSTLLNILAGEIKPSKGSIVVDGAEITSWPVHRRASIIARLFQDPRAGVCENMTIVENMAIAYSRTSPTGPRIAITRKFKELARERLAVLKIGLENRLYDRVDLLSGGQRQSLALIMATLGPAKILLLDEHTAALDPAAADRVMELTASVVDSLELTAMMVTHSMRQALDYGNRLIMLHQGEVILDATGDEREKLVIPDLLNIFHRKQGHELSDDQLLLT